MRNRRMLAGLAAAMLATAACTAGSPASPSAKPTANLPTSVGQGEGAINVLAWPGYVENGSTDAAVDWMSDWEKETGCELNVQVFGTSDEAYSLFSSNPEAYDVISASGDAANRLAAAGLVQPVNTALIPSYADIFPALKDKPWNTFEGVNYGVPHGRGANLLMWRTDQVTKDPTRWAEIFDPGSPYAGKFSVYDAPIYIADAAVVLMKTKPDLNIKNPYALDENQFKAAVDLVKQQKPAVGEYWSDYNKQITSFTNGNTVIGTTWQVIANVLEGSNVPVKTVKPEEGATGWSDTWMINSKTKHLNCAYKFIDHIVSPDVNIQIAEYFGEAPANSKSCALAENPDHCSVFHAEEDDYWKDVWYWTTPTETCLDGRTDVKCKGFDEWVKAWTEIKAS